MTWSPMLACRCGRAMAPADMRRLPPLLDFPSSGLVLARIVCPVCAAARVREIAAMREDPAAEPSEAPRSGAPAAGEAPGRGTAHPLRAVPPGAPTPHHHLPRLAR